jgi:hypothetical protein
MHILFILKILLNLQYWKYTNLLFEICPKRHFFDKWCFSKPISSLNFLFRVNVFRFFESPNSPLSKTGPIIILGLIIVKIFDFENTSKIDKNTPKMHKIKGKHVTNCSGEAKIKQKQKFTQIDLQRDS